MNGITVRNIFRCGYLLCSKDLFVNPRTSRILYNYTAGKDLTSWSNQRSAYISSSFGLKTWSINTSLVTFNHRYLSKTIPHNGKTALKPKSHENCKGDKKQTKDTNKVTAIDQVKSQANIDTKTEHTDKDDVPEVEEKLSLTAKFKKMYKEYWYILLPVHVVTSSFWFTGFYYLSTSGVDIPSLLESMHISEAVINKLRDSSLGHAAIAYLCYKIATPLRYMVTLGGTTLSIKYLSQWGYIRPVPTKAQLKQIYDDQKAKFQHKD